MAFDPDIRDAAAVAHQLWCRRMVAQRWSYGPRYDPQLRQHDALVAFEQLPAHDQRMACRAVEAEDLHLRLAEAIDHDRGPEREFSPEELSAGLPVAWAGWTLESEGGKPPKGQERGRVLSWTINTETGEVDQIKVEWDDGQVSEHLAAEHDLRRVE